MPRYETVVHTAAERELAQLDSDARDRLTDTIVDVAGERQPTSHAKVTQIEGKRGLLRLRVGDVRAILTLDKPELRVLSAGHRSSIYDVIDDINDRRATA